MWSHKFIFRGPHPCFIFTIHYLMPRLVLAIWDANPQWNQLTIKSCSINSNGNNQYLLIYNSKSIHISHFSANKTKKQKVFIIKNKVLYKFPGVYNFFISINDTVGFGWYDNWPIMEKNQSKRTLLFPTVLCHHRAWQMLITIMTN